MSLRDPDFNSSGYVHRSGIAGSCGSSIFNSKFWRAFVLFLIMAVPISVLTNSVLFSTFLPILFISCLFDNSYLNRYKGWLWFYLHFPYSDVEHLFMPVVSVCLLWKNIYSRSFAHFLIR